MNMRRSILMAAFAAAIGLAACPRADAKPNDLSIIASTRIETHTFENTKTGDTALTTSFAFVKNISRAETLIANIGQRMDLDDSEQDNLGLGLTYVRNLTKSTFCAASYSNFKTDKSLDDGRADDTTDMYSFVHGWNVVKQDKIKLSLTTAFNTDTAFSDNRMFSEALNFNGPVGKSYRWGAAYFFGYSLSDHRHSINMLDFKVSKRVSRRGAMSLGYRQVEYLSSVGNDLDDASTILTYSYKLR